MEAEVTWLSRLMDMQASAFMGKHAHPRWLYNEKMLLRLVLDWYGRHPAPEHPLGLAPGANWYVEAPVRPDGHESPSLVDGVLGHFAIGLKDGLISPKAGGSQLVAVAVSPIGLSAVEHYHWLRVRIDTWRKWQRPDATPFFTAIVILADDHIVIDGIAARRWDAVLDYIGAETPGWGASLRRFYDDCRAVATKPGSPV